VEVRYTTDAEGNPVPYDWHVMTVTLTSRPFSQVLLDRMTIDQQAHYFVLMQTNGNRQIVGSPFDFNWQPFISSHYGWRVHPIDGVKSLHRGIDIALPERTLIRAAHSGVVTVAEYMGGFGNVVFIVGDNGIETRYAHCHTLLVSVGDTVEMGDIIATVGSTGASTGNHLHMELLINGVYANPAFFVYMGGSF
jgi:murein DD-endopeptidase MepM/ murein hydrolase activator NlpD